MDEYDPEPSDDTLNLGGNVYSRLRLGEETPPGESPCPGCGAYYFSVHATYCEYEQCPACGGSRVACSCS